ncbi:hypothetical protein ACWGQ2_14380 [Arthrobacter sp. NPDC055585]
MHFKLIPDDISLIRAHLGVEFDLLSRVMLDIDAFPSFLFSDDRPRLVEARGRALELLRRWKSEEPEVTGSICSRLPDFVLSRSVPESLLEAAMWSDEPDPLIDQFGFPDINSRVFAAAPQLVPLLDESGLIKVEALDARPWGLHTGEFAFQYHQLLRRGFGSRIHYGLIGIVLDVAKGHGLSARLALDERRLQFKDEYQEFHEYDYWYGASLSEESLDDLATVGETFHGDPNGGTSLLHPYAGLSVRWTADGNLKTVEIEEFMPSPDPSSDWVYARYLHAIRDTTSRAFIHCDGAVKAYAANRYPRSQHDFKNRGKGDRYRKLFRVDGEFPVAVWSDLASAWFRGNNLINEYFKAPAS